VRIFNLGNIIKLVVMVVQESCYDVSSLQYEGVIRNIFLCEVTFAYEHSFGCYLWFRIVPMHGGSGNWKLSFNYDGARVARVKHQQACCCRAKFTTNTSCEHPQGGSDL
jgi:hypothetical protein